MKCPHCGYDLEHRFATARGWSRLHGDSLGCVFMDREGRRIRVLPAEGPVSLPHMDDSIPRIPMPEYKEEDGIPFLLWNVNGLELTEKIQMIRPTPELIWSWFKQIIESLAILHSGSRVHGFINGRSILVNANNEIIIVDCCLRDGSPTHDLMELARLMLSILQEAERYPGLEFFKKILLKMEEGEFVSGQEVTALNLPFLLRELRDVDEKPVRRYMSYLSEQRWKILIFLALISIAVSLYYSWPSHYVLEPFGNAAAPSVTIAAREDGKGRRRASSEPDRSFPFNRLPAGADVYVFMPEGVSIPEETWKLLGLPHPPPYGGSAWRMPSWRRMAPFSGRGGTVMDTASLLLEAGYDPVHPDPHRALLYMRLPGGSPPRSSIWHTLGPSARPASIAVVAAEGEARIAALFGSSSSLVGVTDALATLLESLDLEYDVYVHDDRLYLTIRWGDRTS